MSRIFLREAKKESKRFKYEFPGYIVTVQVLVKNSKSSEYIGTQPSCNGNHVFMIDHGYPWLFHGHVFIFHTHGQECNHSATKTWLIIVIIMVITSFPMINHSSLKKEYNGRSW